jgi:hypothetical protein
MSTESTRPKEFGPVPEYKTHSELWSEASTVNGDAAAASGDAAAASNGRRVWTKPLLSTLPITVPATRESAAGALAPWSRSYWRLGAIVAGVLLLVFLMLPRRAAKVSSTPANQATQQAMAASSPATILPVLLPPLPADTVALEQLASTQIVTTDDPFGSASDGNEELIREFPRAKKIHLESSIRSQLAREGLPGIGVSVAGDGDVFLNGTFFSRADERRATAMVRANRGVRDIYFSGTVSNEQTATANSSGFVTARSPAYIYRNHYRERVSRSTSRARNSIQ